MTGFLRDAFKNEVIRASAGTGKTFALSNRFLRLLASGAECETILATTFTRKGAGEILDRIVRRLARAALSEEATNELAVQLDWKLDQPRVQELLRRLIKNLHRLQIGTLDAFFYRIAQSFRLELGLPTQWQIVSEQQNQPLRDRIVHEILRDKTVINLLHLMTKGDAQRRVADLIRSTVNQLYEIHTQSDKAAWNWLQRPQSYNPGEKFDSLIERLRGIDYSHRGQTKQIEKEIAIVEQGDWLELADSSILKAIINGSNKYYKPLPPECIELYQQLIEHCCGFVIDMFIRRNSSTFDLLDAFGKRLELEKTETGQLRFGDVTRLLEGFVEGKETDDFSFRLDHNINHLLLDEFQDTSIEQWNVIEPFAKQTTADDVNKSFFCVGDMKQAIYGWRGGAAEIFDRVDERLCNMSDSPPLTSSFRSSQVIIDVVNRVFGNLRKFESDDEVVAQAVDQWAQRFERHQTSRTELPGFFSLEFTGDSEKKSLSDKNRDRNESTMIATVKRIEQLHRQMPDRNIGVLVRKNATVGDLIFRLQEIGIPASEEGGNPLTDSAAVETMLALFTLADHPGDSISRFLLSHSPLANRLGLNPETKSNQTENREAACSAAESIRSDLSIYGYGVTCKNYSLVLATSCTRRELSRLQQLVKEAFNYDESNDQTRIRLRPDRFVNHIRQDFRASDESSARIRIMTVHQSKGLEFDVVVMPMFYEPRGWFTHQDEVIIGRKGPTDPIRLVCRSANKAFRALLPGGIQQAYDENRRHTVRDNLCVLYVAMTRAIHATHVVMSRGCKADQSSSAAVLMSTLLSEVKTEGVAYSCGDPDWYGHVIEAESDPAEPDFAQYYLPDDTRLLPISLASEQRSGRGIAQGSPSRLEGGDTIEMGSLFSSLAKTKRLNRGTILHACFEKIGWLDDCVPDRKQLEDHLKKRGLFDDDADSFLDEFLVMIRQQNLVELLSHQSYLRNHAAKTPGPAKIPLDALRVDVRTERPFAVVVDGELMQGFIDRLVLIYEGDRLVAADIIDFKTDRIVRKGMEERVQFYRPQLTAYRRAASQFCRLPLEKIAAHLVFVESGSVVNFDDSEITTGKNRQTDTNPVNAPKLRKNDQMQLWNDDDVS